MSEPVTSRFQVFDPKQEYSIVERRLPHWSQAGTIAFITWRTWDSIPKAVLEQWLADRDSWLRTHGFAHLQRSPLVPRDKKCSHLAPQDASPVAEREDLQCSHLAPQDNSSCGARGLHWRDQLRALDPAASRELQLYLSDRWNDSLDACHGACVLRRPELSQIVVDSLRHFDGERYDVTDFVVMPNHVHLLAAFPDDESMLRQCDSWKRFTATRINRELSRTGRFWQQDDFDHLVRSPEQFARLRRYIAENPQRARLRPGELRHFSKPL